MASSSTNCGVCDLRNVTKPSTVWCPECDEGLCSNCLEHHGLSKSSRNHITIVIEEYQKLPADILKIAQFCTKHDEKYQTYCRSHDCPCCRRCIIESHNDCKDYAAIDDVIHNIKRSSIFQEMEESVNEIAENIMKIKKNRQENKTSLQLERKAIEKEIMDTRIKINQHLDKLQEDLLKKLYAMEENENIKINKTDLLLEQKLSEINALKTSIKNIKQFASDLQTFLAIKQVERDVADKEKSFQSIIRDQDIRESNMSFEVNSEVSKFTADIPRFGRLNIRFKTSEISIGRQKEKQAQKMISRLLIRSVEEIQVTLQQRINSNMEGMGGCVIHPDNKITITERHFGTVKSINGDGTLDFKIKLRHKTLLDIANMSDINSVAVTSGTDSNKCITIIDLRKKKISKIISVDSFDSGITYKNGKLIYCALNKGIMMLNVDDESISQIKEVDFSEEAYIATYRNDIYFTNYDKETVNCCDLQGRIKWEFKDKNALGSPLGITVDKEGFVYVINNRPERLVVISPDGKHCRQLLSADNGLDFPWAVDFQSSSNKLAIANSNDTVFLYAIDKTQ